MNMNGDRSTATAVYAPTRKDSMPLDPSVGCISDNRSMMVNAWVDACDKISIELDVIATITTTIINNNNNNNNITGGW